MSRHDPVTIQAPAKLNIRLKITGRRQDGYHQLVSIMVPIGLMDHLELDVIPRGIKLTCQGHSVPVDEENLAFRAARSFFSYARLDRGVSIKLTKNIPVGAGLGGGSSDAACVLKGLNDIWSNPLSSKELESLALHLGADVPFFLYNKPCVATGIGEVLEPIEKWSEFWYVIIMPPLHISTSWVYDNLRLQLTSGEYEYINNRIKKGLLKVVDILENDLEEVTASHFPVIKALKKELIDAGAEGALMSGSGPSVFGVFRHKKEALLAKRYLTPKALGELFAVKGLP